MDITSMIIDFECGELDDSGILELFSWMVRTESAWTFQGMYGRMAADLIANGYLDQAGNILNSELEEV
jgi:hypothetical protein